MRWPFVSRAAHDALMAAAEERVQLYRNLAATRLDQMDAELREHRAFVAEMAKATLPPPRPLPAPVKPPRERDEADHAIDTAALFDPKRRRYLEQYVRERRQAGVAAGDIAQAILHPPATGYGEFEE